MRQYWWLYVNLENGFAWWENFENHHQEKLIQISEICKEKWQNFGRSSCPKVFCKKVGGCLVASVLVQSNQFWQFTVILLLILKLMILWNFISKLLLRPRSFLSLNCTHCIIISDSPYSNRLINFSDIFYYFCESKFPKIKRLNRCIKLDLIICLFVTMIMNFFKNYRTRSAEHVQNLVFYFDVS